MIVATKEDLGRTFVLATDRPKNLPLRTVAFILTGTGARSSCSWACHCCYFKNNDGLKCYDMDNFLPKFGISKESHPEYFI